MNKYPIVTLCGSTKFKKEFIQIQKELTLKRNIVLTLGLFGHSGEPEAWKYKNMLDDMHKAKIDLSDAIFIININGYIGESTKAEIEYAKKCNKKIKYLIENK